MAHASIIAIGAEEEAEVEAREPGASPDMPPAEPADGATPDTSPLPHQIDAGPLAPPGGSGLDPG